MSRVVNMARGSSMATCSMTTCSMTPMVALSIVGMVFVAAISIRCSWPMLGLSCSSHHAFGQYTATMVVRRARYVIHSRRRWRGLWRGVLMEMRLTMMLR